MNKRIETHVNALFANTAEESHILDIKEELLANLNEKYEDLIASGKSEDEAFALVISGIGDIDNLLKDIGQSPILISNGRAIDMITSETLLKSEEISLGNNNRITIETTRESIQIRKTNGDKIKVSQYGNPDTKNEELFIVSSSNDSVHIYINKTFKVKMFNFNVNKEMLVVEIPEEFYGNLEATASSGSIKIEDEFELKQVRLNNSSGGTHINNNLIADTLYINTSSGSIKFNDSVTAKDISAKTTSGAIRSTMNIKADNEIELNTSSGSINIDNDITAKDLYAHTNSGGIRMSNVHVDKYDLRCSSGSINIDNISGGGNVNTSSGGIRLALDSPKGDIGLKTASGSIKIKVEPSLQFTLVAQTSSGSIRTNFDSQKNKKGNYATANIGDNPSVNINANASSGSINVEN